MTAPSVTSPPRTHSLDGQQDSVAEPVDWPALLESLDGDEAFARELAETYIDSGNGLMAELTSAVGRGDCATVGRTAHSLKGASANIKAGRVADTAARLEAAAKAGETERLQALAAPLERDYAATTEYLRRKASSG